MSLCSVSEGSEVLRCEHPDTAAYMIIKLKVVLSLTLYVVHKKISKWSVAEAIDSLYAKENSEHPMAEASGQTLFTGEN